MQKYICCSNRPQERLQNPGKMYEPLLNLASLGCFCTTAGRQVWKQQKTCEMPFASILPSFAKRFCSERDNILEFVFFSILANICSSLFTNSWNKHPFLFSHAFQVCKEIFCVQSHNCICPSSKYNAGCSCRTNWAEYSGIYSRSYGIKECFLLLKLRFDKIWQNNFENIMTCIQNMIIGSLYSNLHCSKNIFQFMSSVPSNKISFNTPLYCNYDSYKFLYLSFPLGSSLATCITLQSESALAKCCSQTQHGPGQNSLMESQPHHSVKAFFY